MKESKKLFKGLGFIGIALCVACCALPIVGVVLGVGTLSVLSAYFEWAGIASLVLALVFLGVYLMRKKKAPACDIDCGCKPPDNSLTGPKQNNERMNIACDLTVFTPAERTNHKQQALDILKTAKRITALNDGYSFYHTYSDEGFMSIATWITGERKCCPFFTFELVLEPIDQGYEIALRLRGSKEIKQFLKSGFQANGVVDGQVS